MKNLIAAARIFAFLNLLFVPAIGVLVGSALWFGDRWWFSFLGLPALAVNAYLVFGAPGRKWVWGQMVAIVGFKPESRQPR